MAAHREVTIELVEVTSTGDLDSTTPVAALTEVGAFVRAVQHAVIEGRADLAVHSCKDLPVSGPQGLTAFYPERGSPWDAICGATLPGLPTGARVGTGSPRRGAQIALLRPDVEVADIRGNVDTRLGKVDSGEYDAVILAQAGLDRSGLSSRADQRFEVAEMVPAPSQGALAVEVGDVPEVRRLVSRIDHRPTRREVEAERSLLASTGAGCRSALGAVALAEDNQLTMWAFVADSSGPRRAKASNTDPDVLAGLVGNRLGL